MYGLGQAVIEHNIMNYHRVTITIGTVLNKGSVCNGVLFGRLVLSINSSMMRLLIGAILIVYVTATPQYTKNVGVKGGYGGGYRGGDNFRLYNNTAGQTTTNNNDHEKGVCWIEVPTASLAKSGHVPAGNGSRPDLSRIRSCCQGYIRNIHNFRICDPICTKECINGLCSAPETCTCYPDHVRNKAGVCIPTCPIGCQNGQCAGGECICKDGYRLDSDGKFCVPICRENCGGTGNCTEPNVCECRNGFKSTPEGNCRMDCGRCNGGECVSATECRCRPGYAKNQFGDCMPQCSNDCKPNGQCVAPNKCSYSPQNPEAETHRPGLNPDTHTESSRTTKRPPSDSQHQYPGQQHPGQQYPGQQHPGQQYPGQQYPGQLNPGQQYPGQQYPGQQYPGQLNPGQQYPGQQYPGQLNPGQQYPGQQYPGQQNSGQYYPGQQYPGQKSPGQQYPGQQYPGQQHPSYPPSPRPPYSGTRPNTGSASHNDSNDHPTNYPSNIPDQQPNYPGPSYYPGQSYPGQQQPYYPGQQPQYPDQQPNYPGNQQYPGQKPGYYPSNQPHHPDNTHTNNSDSQSTSNTYHRPQNYPDSQHGYYPDQNLDQRPTNSYRPIYQNPNQNVQNFNPYSSEQIQGLPYQNPDNQYANVEVLCTTPCINGTCVGRDMCVCKPGYVADTSEPSGTRCVPYCTGCTNGVCVSPHVCVCDPGYYMDHTVKGRAKCTARRIRRSLEESKAPVNIAELLVFEIPDYSDM